MTVQKDIEDNLLTTGNFTIQANMPNGKTLVVSGYIYSHNTLEEINKNIDLYHDVVDRQRAKAEIPELESKLDNRLRSLQQLKDHIQNLKNRRDSGKKLTPAEAKQIDDLLVNVGVLEKDIADGRVAVVEAKQKVGILK